MQFIFPQVPFDDEGFLLRHRKGNKNSLNYKRKARKFFLAMFLFLFVHKSLDASLGCLLELLLAYLYFRYFLVGG